MRRTSAWVLYCKFSVNLQNTFLEKHLWGTASVFISFVLAKVINNTIYWLAFIVYRPEFVDWSKTLWKFSLFDDIFGLRCNWITCYIFISIFSQTNARVLHRCSLKKTIRSIPVVNGKRINFINNGQMSTRYFYFKLFSFDQNLNSPKYGA